MTTEVRYSARDGEVIAALARPTGESPAPAIILLTDIWGLRDAYRRKAERLAAAGFVVLVPDVYYRMPLGEHPTGEREDFATPGVRERVMGWKDTLTRERITSDMQAALDFLAAQPFVTGKVGVAGYCMGGAMAMWTAAGHHDRIGAAASFHGGGLATDDPDSPHRLTADYKCELYFGHADKDSSCPPEQIGRLNAALAEAHLQFASEHYAGCLHGWTVDDAPVFNEAGADRHYAALVELMGRGLTSNAAVTPT